MYNEKDNYVVIQVVCCSPEKIKQKIKCRGGDTIKRIEEIKQPEPKPAPNNPQETPAKSEKKPPETPAKSEKKPPETERPPDQKKVPKPVCVPERPTCCTECREGRGGGPCHYGPGTRSGWGAMPVPVRPTCCTECHEGRGGGPCLYGPGTRPWPPLTPKPCPAPAPVIVPVYPSRFRTCCTECSEGRDGGPCHYGQGRPPPCYDGYYGRPIYDSYGGGCEETSFGCTIM